jgi:hypothetical protein
VGDLPPLLHGAGDLQHPDQPLEPGLGPLQVVDAGEQLTDRPEEPVEEQGGGGHGPDRHRGGIHPPEAHRQHGPEPEELRRVQTAEEAGAHRGLAQLGGDRVEAAPGDQVQMLLRTVVGAHRVRARDGLDQRLPPRGLLVPHAHVQRA